MARASKLKLLSMFAVMLMCATAAFVVIGDSDESDAALGTYTGGTNSSSADNPYTGVNLSGNNAIAAWDDLYVQVGSSFTMTTSNGYTMTCQTRGSGLTVSGTGTSISGTVTGIGSYYINTRLGTSSDSVQHWFYVVEKPEETNVPVTSVSISGSSSVDIGSTITLTATTSPTSATDRHVTWSITSGSSRATISSTSNTSTGGTCVIEGVSAGSVIVKATATDGSGKSATKTITVNAEETTYYLNFDKKGGSGGPSNMSYSTTASSYTFTIPYSEPTKSGYTFKGWSTSSSATTVTHEPGETINVTSEKTLYAVWGQESKTLTLSYNANGGTGAPSSQNGTTTSSSYTFTIPATTPIKTNYTFKGWSTSSAATTAQKQPGDTISISTNTTLYAVWVENAKNTFAIVYNVNGGTGSISGSNYSSHDTTYSFTVTSSVPTAPAGKEFKGWSTTSTGSVEKVVGNTVTCNANSTVTLYAVYEDIVYTYAIAYHANGGTDAPASTTGTSTGSFLMLTVTSEEPTYPGMIFLGWSEDRNAASPTYYAGNSIKVTSTTTLYAVWKEAHITVSGNPVKTTVAGNSWSYTPTVSEVGTTLKVSGASWMSVVNGTIVGTPTTPGEYNVTITAEKTGFSNGTQTFTVTVIPALSFSSAPTGGVIAYAV